MEAFGGRLVRGHPLTGVGVRGGATRAVALVHGGPGAPPARLHRGSPFALTAWVTALGRDWAWGPSDFGACPLCGLGEGGGLSTCCAGALLSLWIGGLGIVLTALATGGVLALARSLDVAMLLSPVALMGTAVLILVITVVSGLAAIKPLFKADPAGLLR